MSFGWSSVTGAASGAWNSVTSAGSAALNRAESLGSAAMSRATELGRDGLDLGRRAVTAVGELDVKSVGDAAIRGVGALEARAESGIRSGAFAAGRGVHRAADFARDHMKGDGLLAQAGRAAVDGAETDLRVGVGAVGGVANGVVGLAGSVSQLGILAAEYRFSPAARDAINSAVAQKVDGGLRAAGDYASAVYADPGRLPGDILSAGGAAIDAGVALGGRTIDSARTAIAEGHGPESFGLVAGEAATYLVPVGGEAKIAAEGGGAVARGLVRAGVEDTARAATVDGARALTADTARVVTSDGARTLAEDGARSVGTDGTKAGVEDAARTEATRPQAEGPPPPPKPLPPISPEARAAVPEAARRTGLSESKITEILETPKADRPPAGDYLSPSYTAGHLAQWDDGAVRFSSRAKYAEYGSLGPPSTFTIPAGRFSELVKSTGGDLRAIEQKLGLSSGYLGDADTMIAYVKRSDLGNLHIPSGGESGALEHWVPGGYTSGGFPEAVADLPKGTPFQEITLAPAAK